MSNEEKRESASKREREKEETVVKKTPIKRERREQEGF